MIIPCDRYKLETFRPRRCFVFISYQQFAIPLRIQDCYFCSYILTKYLNTYRSSILQYLFNNRVKQFNNLEHNYIFLILSIHKTKTIYHELCFLHFLTIHNLHVTHIKISILFKLNSNILSLLDLCIVTINLNHT